MSAVVIDANLVVSLTLPLPYSDAAKRKFEEWLDSGTELLGPTLLGYEVTSTLRKATKLGSIRAAEARAAVERFGRLGIAQVPPTLDSLLRSLEWAVKLESMVAYDAAYLVLAEERQCELWTADGALARACRAKNVSWIRSVS